MTVTAIVRILSAPAERKADYHRQHRCDSNLRATLEWHAEIDAPNGETRDQAI